MTCLILSMFSLILLGLSWQTVMGGRCGYTSGVKGSLLKSACNCLENDDETGGTQWFDPTSKCELLFDSEKKMMGFDLIPKTCKAFASQTCKNVISERANHLKQRGFCLTSNTPYKKETDSWVNTMNSCSVP